MSAPSEAGAGKTWEIREVACRLRSEGKEAFFIRLEQAPHDFESAFEEGSFEDFQAWLAGSEDGWLLLDSVDESRLRSPHDFERAVRGIGRRVAPATARVHVVITGRPPCMAGRHGPRPLQEAPREQSEEGDGRTQTRRRSRIAHRGGAVGE